MGSSRGGPSGTCWREGSLKELGARRGSTSWLGGGRGAHEEVYEVVALLSGREGSSQGRELEGLSCCIVG